MPELPEVETIRRRLQPYLSGKRFGWVEVVDPTALCAPSVEEFTRRLLGQEVKQVARRGKYLLLRLQGLSLIFHLRMTGILLQTATADYGRARFRLHDGSWLLFADRRRLGKIWLVEDERIVVGKLGIEPLGAAFTAERFTELLQKRTAPIKALLLDQGFLAGVGNMYADEALFLARVHPLKQAKELTTKEVERLFNALRSVLTSAIENQGASVDTYRLPDGQRGQAQSQFQVAHRGGQPCPHCTTPIERLPLRGRGAYFCPLCQRL